jgi:hypothetical protein
VPPFSSATASDVLIDALSKFEHQSQALVDDLRDTLRRHRDDASFAGRLIEVVGDDTDRRAALLDFVGHAAAALAPLDDPPANGAAAIAWSALVAVANSLNGSGAHALGRPRFISDVLFRSLVAESRRQFPLAEGMSATRETGRPGDLLAALAVSRQLRECVSAALGFAVVPPYEAVYEYDPPGSHVRTHVDSRDYEIVFHLLLAHASSLSDARQSTLIVHLPGERSPTRIALSPGDAVVLHGRGTIHSWQALRDDERRTLIAVGFRTVTA